MAKAKKVPWAFRQGDVLIMEVEKIPAEARNYQRKADRSGRTVVAYGEATGHSHTIDAKAATAFGASDDAFWLEIHKAGATMIHQEHAPASIPKTVKYLNVRTKREFSEVGERRVQD